MKKILTTLTLIITATAGLATCSTVEAQLSKENDAGSKIRVGVFDSRALAMAFYRSDEFKKHLKELHAEHEKAKADGNEERVKELDAFGPALQEQLHRQGFSTWPVDNILEKIKSKLPEIAAQANVDIIISKWHVAYQKPKTELVDITELLVRLFNPDAETLKIIADIQKQVPVPLEMLKRDHD